MRIADLTHSSPRPHDTRTSRAQSRTVEDAAPWILAALLSIGTLLRLIDLGELSFRWDEDLSSLAAKAIAMHGIPELPSGMIYPRSLPFLYVLAGSGMLFGFDEWSLRLPAVLFGVASIALAFAFGKSLFDTKVGLVMAALVTFSAWDIEFSRYARMYAPFAFFYVLTLLAIWRYLVAGCSRAGAALAIVLALAALSLHELAYSLALAFLLPIVIDGRRTLAQPGRAVLPLVGFASVAAAFFVWARIQDRLFDRPAMLAAGGAEAPADLPLPTLEDSGAAPGGPLALLWRIVSAVRPPDLPAFSALLDTAPAAALAFPALALLAAGVFVWARRFGMHPAAYLLVPLIALLCGVHLFNLALLATIALAFVRREGVRALRAPEVLFSAALIAISFAAWLAVTVQLDLLGLQAGLGATIKESLRQLLNYPSFFVFWGFPNEYPLTSIAALLGGLWAFDRIARPQPDRNALFVVLAFALPILLNGIFETRYQSFRYNVPYTTLFFVFVALGIVKWPELASALRSGERAAARRADRAVGGVAVTALLVALVAAYDMNPLKGWLVTQREYSNEGRLYEFFELRGFRDYRTAAAFVGAHAGPGDTLISFDCREYYNYLDRMDYCIVSGTYRSDDELIQTYLDNGTIKDLYVGTPMLLDAEDLERALAESRGDVWILASDNIFEDDDFPPDVVAFLAQRQEQVVHVARDGITKVYRF